MDAATVMCPSCGTASLFGKRFCAECGSALPLLCPGCGSAITATQKFCAECGTALRGEPIAGAAAGAPAASPAVIPSPAPPTPPSPPPSEERRLVTALFCDLVGFTPPSEALDPEEVRDLQAQYFQAMADQISRYGGTVEKYAGDAVLALFGAPMAHEDDAERAVLCALGMQGAIEPVAVTARERWQANPQIRVGVNTGEVVSGTWDASGRQDVAVTGDALNTAARIQSVAEPGEILVGAETMRLTRRRIVYGERRDVTLKGKVALVPVWPAEGIREEFGERWEGYETPLIGRDREMSLLLEAWVRAQGGEGQLVAVVGDAGVGKSRLIAEALGRIAAASAVRVVRARSLSYGQEISLWLIADLLRSLFGIKEQDALPDVAATLQIAIPMLLGDAEIRAEARDVLGEVLGLPIGESAVAKAGPEARRQTLIRVLRALLGATSDRAPAVIVLEDLHWIDNASQAVLAEVLADVLGMRVLVLAAQRPGWTAPWSEWGWPERMTLRPLGDRDTAALAEAVVGGTRLASDLERHVAERAGGNPFFVEEMLRALQETGGLERRDGQMSLVADAANRLPSTLTEVLLARLDRLGGETKQVAQVASVIGRSFSVPLLAEVVGQAASHLDTPLTQLQRAEIAFPRRNPDLEYVFKHVSMRDVAYNTLVQRRRQELHLRTARAIAALYPSDEYAEMIAYHYARTEAPEAAEWLERAGDRAAAVYANGEARDHYGEAMRRLEQQGAEQAVVARLNEKIGSVLLNAGRYDEGLEPLRRAAETARSLRDLDMAGRVTARIGMAHRYRGTPDEGIALVSPMIDLLAWSGPSEALAALYVSLASLYILLGRYSEQITAADRRAEVARAIGNDRLLGEALERRAAAMSSLGHPEEALQTFNQAIPLIETGGDLAVLWRVFNNAAVASGNLGKLRQSMDYLHQALGVAERVGNPDQTAFILGNIGSIRIELGEWQGAREALEKGAVMLGDQQTANAATPPGYLGQLALYQGDWDEAGRLLRDALAIGLRTGERVVQEEVQAFLAELDVLTGRPDAAIRRVEGLITAEAPDYHVPVVLAWALLEAGRVDEAADLASRSVQRAREEMQRNFLMDALRVQGMVLRRQGRHDEADTSLAEGLDLARALPTPYAEARILEQLGQREEALAIFRRLGALKDVERLEQGVAEGTG
ncbi:MAG TPA: adenylate/guanylate cyclase domain-containing protein [Chloroflexota bacterium]|nr:adenylate/guanylate cyclase domain-containing protein [Chloroflexota bacterium]